MVGDKWCQFCFLTALCQGDKWCQFCFLTALCQVPASRLGRSRKKITDTIYPTRLWFIDAMEFARQRRRLALWAYVIMPEHIHIIVFPKESVYQVKLIRTALKVPVQRKALAFLRHHAPAFLSKLRDEQPNGEVHYRFWQRGGGYDRNITETTTLWTMIDYIHENPVRRGLVSKATDWIWSSARFYAGMQDVPIRMDPLPVMDG